MPASHTRCTEKSSEVWTHFWMSCPSYLRTVPIYKIGITPQIASHSSIYTTHPQSGDRTCWSIALLRLEGEGITVHHMTSAPSGARSWNTMKKNWQLVVRLFDSTIWSVVLKCLYFPKVLVMVGWVTNFFFSNRAYNHQPVMIMLIVWWIGLLGVACTAFLVSIGSASPSRRERSIEQTWWNWLRTA